jgi:acetyl-CoA C-acetyltransferase
MSSETDPVVIVGMARTPMGGLLGELSGFDAYELGAVAIKKALEEAKLDATAVDQVLMGNVLGAGQGQAPARQAALTAGLSKHAEATTLNKMCGSGMQAAILARALIQSGEIDVAVAGGMESMTNAPFILPKMREGHKYGHDKVYDHMARDGLEDAYEGLPMGVYADKVAKEYQFTREAQDAYALETLKRAQAATAEGRFTREIAPLETLSKGATIKTATDELPRKARPEKIPSLKPAFTSDGTVTAANASAISDGAAALVMMRESEAKKRGLKPLAKIIATAAHAHEPAYFTTAPVPAMRKVLEKAGWSVGDVDLWEINEAFAVVPMIAMHELGIPREKLNVNGGACALGHPIGASGARIMVTLIAALEERGETRGVASLCIGGGEATAVALERM